MHRPFKPFKNDTTFLDRPLTPFPDNVVDEGENANESGAENEGVNVNQQAMPPPPPMQPQCVPPAGYFELYFVNMQQGIISLL
jgi:hypothetical protein